MSTSMRARFRELGRDTVLYGLSNAAAKSVSLLLLPVYTRYLAPSEFGLMDLALIVVTVLNLLMQAELNGAIKRYLYEYPEERRFELVSTVYAAVLALSGAVALAGLAAAGPLSRLAGGGAHAAVPLRLAVGIAFFGSLASLASVQLRMERRVREYSATQFLTIALSGALSVGFLVGLDAGVSGVMWGNLLGTAAGSAVATWWIRGRLRRFFDRALLRRCLRYTLPLIPSAGSGYLRRFGDRAVILMYLPLGSLGVYAAGYRLAMIPTLLIQAFQLSWSPLAMSLLNDPAQKDVYARALRYYALLMGITAGAVAACAPELMLLLGSGQYAASRPLIGWMVGATVVNGAGSFVTVGAMVAEKTSVHVKGAMTGAVAALGLMAVLIPFFGLEGAAVAVFVGTLAGAVSLYHMSQRHFRVAYAGGRILALIALYALLQGVLLRWAATLHGAASPLVRLVLLLAFAAAACLLLLEPQEAALARRKVRERFAGGDRSPRGAAQRPGVREGMEEPC
jgi:O-antigen/teichoic acid export membrane protein